MTTPKATDASPTPSSSTTTTTTRICIKNLPLSFTSETKLKTHLQSSQSQQPKLQITDCKILKTPQGKSRKIAFVGFVSSTQAQSAVSYFDKSFAGTSRLSVSLAFSKKKPSADKEEYRPWSKHSIGSSRYDKLHPKEVEEENEDGEGKEKKIAKNEKHTTDAQEEEVDKKRDEFLSAMGISTTSSSKQQKKEGESSGNVSKSKFWANDDVMVDDKQHTDSTAQDVPKEKMNESDDSSSSSSSVDSDDSDEEDDANKAKEKQVDDNQKMSSDLDFLKSKQVDKADILSDESDDDDDDSSSVSSSDSSSSDDSSNEDEHKEGDSSKEKKHVKSDEPSDKAEQKTSEEPTSNVTTSQSSNSNNTQLHDRLFVRNLPFTTTEEELHETFSQIASVTSVHIPIDDTKRNKGYAFINFESHQDAKLAMDTMDGEDFQGRLIHILPARPSADQVDASGGDLTYKEQQALLRQKEAEKSSMGWSASYLRGDAVADNVADRLGVSKGEVLNVKDGISSGNAAVRLALGETHIIAENIAFFEEHGVDVTALEASKKSTAGKSSGSGSGSGAKRSKTMILVKNLPYDTTLEELTKVFHGIGGDAPQRMLLPPSKTAALVEYGHATDARRAFRRLAYKKFKHVPLYLEWAPMKKNIGGEQQESATDNTTAADSQEKHQNVTVGTGRVLVHEDPSTETADTMAGVSQTIYVKNLNFSTSEDQLKKAFTKAGCQPRAVKIPTKAAPVKRHKSDTNPSSSNAEMRQVSMGFGFVEFPTEEEALKAMKALQGKLVDGHALEIKLSTKSLSSTKVPPADKSSKNTKIMVRNVPFEATRTELLQLFGSFGQLKKVRLPKKFDGTHRGFAFCEFVTNKEAQNAMTTLSRTHLYGRHLVLEWAAEGGEDEGNTDVGAARERAKRDAMSLGAASGSSKKRGKHLKF